MPTLEKADGDDHFVACWRWETIAEQKR